MDMQQETTFSDIRERLSQIEKLVKSDDVSLDKALDLYDEAIKLGMKADELLEDVDAADVAAAEDAASSDVS
ncbi:exodeoxyribonuclease VII small subunit [Slackia heliotrinireducens]|jgi:exodeoxyribonuclease VII small subunit|uniref:Uncharacterized protein n=1 Tax=Slackia heliotrinireducens (strain ATCC 29202 / DSM 20476 / NCTC 11029 / RHS 1) TaxID=471855 RepID=C7N4M2_SLAHD|nr:exodeoxyribonuclease VII small subunit [Slackia heliotrinireducens]ACV21857.1 hypothetical protein Shel_08010 [Slackia heliotrinireducens DSM 20476]VEG99611.1 Uncharacterised protein [Slackia heliotrinireducens]